MGNLRITGLATGLDVDNTVKQMMLAHRMRVDKFKQNKQVIQWRQDIYRDLLGGLNNFKTTYLDILKPEKYMLSSKNYSNFDVINSSSNPSVKLTTTTGVLAGNYKIKVNKLAEGAKITGTNTEINIEEAINDFTFPAQITADNKVISINFADGISHEITLEEKNYNLSELVNSINNKLSSATNGDISKNVKAVLDGQGIKFVSMKELTEDTTLKVFDEVDGKEYSIVITKGTYGLDNLKDIINGKLKIAKDSDGNTVDLSSKFQVSLSEDGSKINLPANMKIDGSSGSYFETGMLVNNTDIVTTNRLEYDRKIIDGVNNNLSIRINGIEYKVNLGAFSYGKATGGSTDENIRNDFILKLKEGLKTSKDLSGNTKNLLVDEKIDARLSFDGKRIQFVSNSNKTITVSGNATELLGFSDGFEISQSIDDKMSILLQNSVSGKIEFTINDGTKNVIFRYDFNSTTDVTEGSDPDKVTYIGAKNKTIKDIMSDISAKANVKLSYSQLTRKFTLESNSTGASQNITVKTTNIGDTNTDNLLISVFGGTNITDNGEDAQVTITDPANVTSDVTKSTNSFTMDGIYYELLQADNVENVVTLNQNINNTFDKIKEFIDKYNETIDKINEKIGQKKQYSYAPLTDEQKKDMSEDDIKKWEERAKEGLLSRDSNLEDMLTKMRRAFFDSVPSAGISLSEIGLSTSRDISERGKIVINEEKLKNALKNNGDKVTELFTKASSISYKPGKDNTARYNEEGIFQRINDVLNDNLRTNRDENGKKGFLIEKAGIKGDYSEFNNILSEQIKNKDKIINEMEKKLIEKENRYYMQFSQLEKAMQKLNDQSNWLYQQLGMSGK